MLVILSKNYQSIKFTPCQYFGILFFSREFCLSCKQQYKFFVYSHVIRHEKYKNIQMTFICKISTVKIMVPHLTTKYTRRKNFQIYGMRNTDVYLPLLRVTGICVTGFVKIDSNCTRTDIHFIAEHYSCTTCKCLTHGYRWPSLLSQTAFCHPCQTTKVHYRVFWASEWH